MQAGADSCAAPKVISALDEAPDALGPVCRKFKSFPMKTMLRYPATAVAVVLFSFAFALPSSAQTSPSPVVNAIEGVVSGPSGPEAGVWVIAETHDLPTKY